MSLLEKARKRLGLDVAELGDGEREGGHGLVVGGVEYGHDVVGAERPIALLHGAAGLLGQLLDAFGALDRVLDALDALLGVVGQQDVGRHGLCPPGWHAPVPGGEPSPDRRGRELAAVWATRPQPPRRRAWGAMSSACFGRRSMRSHRPWRSSSASTASSVRLWARASWRIERPPLKAAASSPVSPSYQRAPERAGNLASARVRVLRWAASASSRPSQATIGRVSALPCGEVSVASSPPLAT